jgi:hypothetical protein
MSIPHPSIPRNPSLWALHRLHDQATRWLDHADSEEDSAVIEEFIYELEIKINEFTQVIEHLDSCLAHAK